METNVVLTVEEARELTSSFLGGHWSNCSNEDIELKDFGAGLSNSLFYVENKSIRGADNRVPRRVLVRKYGGKAVELDDPFKSLSEAAQVQICVKLGELGLGPKIWGIFEGGRIEEFIPSHTLSDEDLMDKKIRLEVARKLARMHSLTFPISKKPMSHVSVMEIKLKNFCPEIFEQESLKDCSASKELLATFNYQAEFDWMKDMALKVGGRTNFSLNDMNRLNCLVRDQLDTFGERVTLIDYEMSSENFRGADIANHLIMQTIDLSSETLMSTLNYPNEEMRREFVEEYLRLFKELSPLELDPNGLDSVKHVLMETDFYATVYTMFMVVFIIMCQGMLGSPTGAKFLLSEFSSTTNT